MTKSPVLFSLGVSVVISIVVLMLWLEVSRNVDEHAFITAGVFVMFPFLWFVTWLIVNAVVWWNEVAGGRKEGDSTQKPEHPDTASKSPRKLRKT